MQNWNNSDDLANEYATDLKALKSLYNDYKAKRDNCLKRERECQEQGDWDTAQTYREEYQQHLTNAKEIGSIISSSEYSIKWLRTGAEPKTVASVTQLSYEQRTVLVSDVDQALMYLNTLKTEYSKMDEEKLHELHIFLNGMTERERDAFISIKGQGNSFEKTAQFMGVSKGTVQDYIKRAEDKIARHLDKGLQISLF
ncbi:sigma factor-like helix-turn-helix DNA-binding protein [Jeotgalibaca arthritidis]|uniref:sigma factor-like helix-turn-helix DNA-binding protein n=1 Tax=Jeotgalibaca arthritidis TaxID=1868794 RepID=UPI00359F9EB9